MAKTVGMISLLLSSGGDTIVLLDLVHLRLDLGAVAVAGVRVRMLDPARLYVNVNEDFIMM